MILLIFFLGIPVALIWIGAHIMKLDKNFEELKNDVEQLKNKVK